MQSIWKVWIFMTVFLFSWEFTFMITSNFYFYSYFFRMGFCLCTIIIHNLITTVVKLMKSWDFYCYFLDNLHSWIVFDSLFTWVYSNMIELFIICAFEVLQLLLNVNLLKSLCILGFLLFLIYYDLATPVVRLVKVRIFTVLRLRIYILEYSLPCSLHGFLLICCDIHWFELLVKFPCEFVQKACDDII